jgi:hypothetical protein
MSSTATFAGQLRHFARSVDIVDDEIFDRVRQIIYRYVRNELGAAYFEVMREQPIEGEPSLRMFWSSEDRDHIWRIRQADGSFTNLVTMALGRDQPLWICSPDKKPLNEADELTDDWSHNESLPNYQPNADQAIRTLVIMPLRRRRPLGVCYFESTTYIGITDVAKTELQLLGDSIAILLELYEVNRSQSMMTSSAISELQENLESAQFPRLTRPHFFVAFSNRADSAVTNVISEVLHELSDHLEFTDWTQMAESGNINAQISKEIMRARFGICYLSEPAADETDSKVKYVDNPNVVFESGMLHARTAATDASGAGAGEPMGWIPMRETASPPAPFDFAAERTLLVPRFEDGSLNEKRLRDALRVRIGKLLGDM